MSFRVSRFRAFWFGALLAPGAHAAGGSDGTDTTTGAELSTSGIAECVAAHDAAGTAKLDEQWLAAREAATRCAVATCPLALRSDCRGWLDEIAALLPTVLVVVERDDGKSGAVKLELDGRGLPLGDPPEPVETTPGTHRLRVQLEGYAPFELDVRLEPGEKNHVVRARFVRPVTAPKAEQPAPVTTRPHVVDTRPVPTAAYAYAGGALAAFGVSGALLGSALASRANAREECAPACAPSVRRSIEMRLLIADVFGATGIVLGGLAVYSYVKRPTLRERTVALGVRVGATNAGPKLLLEGAF
jgi:hypothetical protein